MAFTFAAFCYIIALIFSAFLIFFAIWHIIAFDELKTDYKNPIDQVLSGCRQVVLWSVYVCMYVCMYTCMLSQECYLSPRNGLLVHLVGHCVEFLTNSCLKSLYIVCGGVLWSNCHIPCTDHYFINLMLKKKGRTASSRKSAGHSLFLILSPQFYPVHSATTWTRWFCRNMQSTRHTTSSIYSPVSGALSCSTSLSSPTMLTGGTQRACF